MNEPTPMTTLVEILEKLRKRGITQEIRMDENKNFILQDSDKIYTNPEELKIVRTYRFEGDSNPSDNIALYILEDIDNQMAIIIETYGAESSYDGSEFDDFLKAIPVDEEQNFRLG